MKNSIKWLLFCLVQPWLPASGCKPSTTGKTVTKLVWKNGTNEYCWRDAKLDAWLRLLTPRPGQPRLPRCCRLPQPAA